MVVEECGGCGNNQGEEETSTVPVPYGSWEAARETTLGNGKKSQLLRCG